MHSNINKTPVQGLSMAEQVAHIKTKGRTNLKTKYYEV